MDYNKLDQRPDESIPHDGNIGSEQLGTVKNGNFSASSGDYIGNFQNVGNKAMNLPESSDMGQNSKELGEIMDFPQNSNATAIQSLDENNAKNLFSEELIETKSSLGKDGIKEVEKAIENFEKDGDAASFYDIARKMMEVNLDNSYNRKIGGGSAA